MAEQILRMSRARRGFQHPQRGAARGYLTPRVAPTWRGCLQRFACFRPRRPPLSEQILSMPRARC
eukprot:8233007-Pyramimonas_sp.AAC.1